MTPSKPKSATKSATCKTPGSGGGRGRGRPKKNIDDDGESSNDLGDASPSVGRKRARTAEAPSSTSKKVKKEQVEEDNIFQHDDFFPVAEEDEAAQFSA